MNDDWVEAKACSWIHEALFFRSVLEAAGIESMIPNEHTIGVQPLYADLLGGVRVLVRADDLDRAKELLESAAAPTHPDTNGEE
jgi:hypothetical protein